MKRLFIIKRESLGARYGVGTYIRQLVSCFDKEEWKVVVVELFAFGTNFIKEECDGVICYRIPFWKRQHFDRSEEVNNLYYRSIFYFLATQTFPGDRIYCHFNFVYEYTLAQLFREELQARVVLTLHYMEWSFDLLGDRAKLQRILTHPGEKDKGVVWRFEAEKRFMMDCCDRVIAIARHSYDTLYSLYNVPKSKLVCIPNALKDEYTERTLEERKALRQKYGFKEEERLIIFAGRLNPVKGIRELLQAFKLLQEEIPYIRLIVAGNEGLDGCCETVAPLWSRVVFTGFVPKEQLFELYAISDVGVVPSIHEEFGYVAVEMMMNNLPLIVSDTTGLNEITAGGKYALLVDMNDPDKRVERLKQGLQQWFAGKHPSFSGRCRFKEEYDLKKFKQRIELLYRNLNNI